MMAFALLESLTVTGILILLSALLPSNWLKNGFAYKGFIIIIIATIDAILFQKKLGNDYPSTLMIALSSIVPILFTVFLIWLSHAKPKMQSVLSAIQDRFLIMLFVYVPIGLICIIAVAFRNLL